MENDFIFKKEHLMFEYTGKASDTNDDPTKRETDSKFLNRNQDYEIVKFINDILKNLGNEINIDTELGDENQELLGNYIEIELTEIENKPIDREKIFSYFSKKIKNLIEKDKIEKILGSVKNKKIEQLKK